MAHDSNPDDTDVHATTRLDVLVKKKKKPGTSHEPAAEQRIAAGTQIGRYEVAERIGAGGMAVVYQAYDPKLHRNVALKLVKARGEGQQAQQRLLREAQAMAKLSHPNVIAVYDVGTWGDQVFLAMELVQGETLRQWMKRKHSRDDIIAMFTQAGRGLAAAHAEGLVHRDFKPDNALVGRDGRLRVLDLGLAQPTEELVLRESRVPGRQESSDSQNQLARTLTQTGSVLGTPIYMAPEQHLAQPTDARCDQFAFAVALHEALYGERPFAGKQLVDLIENVSKGNVREAPPDSQVPAWLRKVVLRGLDPEPNNRFEGMEEMLAAMATDPGARRRRVAAIVGLLGLVQVAVLGIFLGATKKDDDKPVLCPSAVGKLSGVWDTGVRAEVRAAFVASKRPHAKASFARIAQRLDDYTKQWLAMENASCKATRLAGKQPVALMEQRAYCLDRRVDELRGLTGLLAEPDDAIIDKSIKLTESLTSLDVCADKATLAASAPLPTNPQQRLDVAALDAKLQQALALREAGSIKKARDRMRELATEADRIGYGPLQARVLRHLAKQEHRLDRHDVAEQMLRHAATIAARSRDTTTVAQLWIDLTSAATQDEKMKQAQTVLWYAEAATHLAGDPPGPATALALVKAELQRHQGKYDAAIHNVEAALAALEKRHGAQSSQVSSALNKLGIILVDAGKYARARKVLQRGLDIDRTIYGDPHPALIALLANLANAHSQLGDHDAARKMYLRAHDTHIKSVGPEPHGHLSAILGNIAIIDLRKGDTEAAMKRAREALDVREKVSGKDHPANAGLLTTIAQILRAQDKPKEALPYLRRALDIRERHFGKDNIVLTTTLQNLANTHDDLGERDQARRMLQRAIDIHDKTGNREHVDMAFPLVTLGSMDGDAERWKSSLAAYTRAEKLFAKALPEDHSYIGVVLWGQGRALLGLGRSAEAIPIMQRAVRIRVKRKAKPDTIASAENLLARAMWKANVDRAKAAQIFKSVRARFVAAGKKRAEDLADFDAWLRSNRVRLR